MVVALDSATLHHEFFACLHLAVRWGAPVSRLQKALRAMIGCDCNANRAVVEETLIISQGKVWYGKHTVDTKVPYFNNLAACDLHLRPSLAPHRAAKEAYLYFCGMN